MRYKICFSVTNLHLMVLTEPSYTTSLEMQSARSRRCLSVLTFGQLMSELTEVLL
jgi:hypothetical protein